MRGVAFQGANKKIPSAACLGNPRYGTKIVGDQLNYHRFACTLLDANYNTYQADVVITKNNATTFWWQILSIKAA